MDPKNEGKTDAARIFARVGEVPAGPPAEPAADVTPDDVQRVLASPLLADQLSALVEREVAKRMEARPNSGGLPQPAGDATGAVKPGDVRLRWIPSKLGRDRAFPLRLRSKGTKGIQFLPGQVKDVPRTVYEAAKAHKAIGTYFTSGALQVIK